MNKNLSKIPDVKQNLSKIPDVKQELLAETYAARTLDFNRIESE